MFPKEGSRVLQPVTTETLLIDGVERPTRNSNGAYIHSTDEATHTALVEQLKKTQGLAKEVEVVTPEENGRDIGRE